MTSFRRLKRMKDISLVSLVENLIRNKDCLVDYLPRFAAKSMVELQTSELSPSDLLW